MTEPDSPETNRQEKNSVLRAIDEPARALARQLLRATPTGALGSLDPVDGSPFTSLTTVATDLDGTPLILISTLSTHTRALQSDARCSLLLSASGRGDALAHPRITLIATARFLERDSDAGQRAARRFLMRHDKARLYADFGDFSYVRLEIRRASLNGGFGKAYEMQACDLLSDMTALPDFEATETSAADHMNEDHPDAINAYASVLCRSEKDDDNDWRMTGIDPHGFDLASGASVCRVAFDPPLTSAGQIRSRLVELAKQARAS